MRKFFPYLAGAAALLLVAFAVYVIFFRPLDPGLEGEEGGPLFGEAGEFTGNPEQGNSIELGQGPVEEVAPRFVKITEGPVAMGIGVRSATRPVVVDEVAGAEGDAPVSIDVPSQQIRFVERKSGNIYAYDPDDRALTRLTNETVPGVVEAVWAPDASMAFARFLSGSGDSQNNIDTYALAADEETATRYGFFLEAGLSEVVVTGSSSVVTLLPSSEGAIATIAGLDGANPRTLFTTPLSKIRLYAAGNRFMTATYASASSEGYAFLVNGADTFERLLGPLRALTILPSPSGASVLYSYLSGTAAKAELLNTEDREVTSLPLAVLPEKCVWTFDESALYCAVPRALGRNWPDHWYQGAIAYSDRIWKIDLKARLASQVLDPETVAAVPIDAVSLTLDPETDYLVFVNRTDGSLWAYDL